MFHKICAYAASALELNVLSVTCMHAGPVSTAHMAALEQCLDAMLATGVIADSDRMRLEDLLLMLGTLAFHTPLCHQARGCATQPAAWLPRL